MLGLKSVLPAPKNAWHDELLDDLDDVDGSSKIIADSTSLAVVSKTAFATPALPNQTSQAPLVRRAPPYLQRQNWLPKEVEDFDGGGAFPEIHIPQYPLKMGLRGESSSAIIPLEVDETGKVRYDALVKQGMRKGTWVHTSFQDMVEKVASQDELAMPTEEQIQEATENTRKELEKIVNTRIQANKSSNSAISSVKSQKRGPTYMRYTPQQSTTNHNSGAQQRIISLVESQRDPLEPPRHQHKRVPGGIPSPPPPVQHSPPRKLSAQDQQDWKIPACISNWKNPKGFTIPLDKRMAADGSGLQQVQMNNGFGQFMEALYIAERNARDEVRKRNELQKRRLAKEKEAHEQNLRDLAAKTRMERSNVNSMAKGEVSSDQKRRDEIRDLRKREREDDRREAMKKSKTHRDLDRDISEKIALGQAGRMTRQGEGLYDARLFNQEQGVSHSLGDDDAYNIYDKPLMSGSSANQLYRPNKDNIRQIQEDDDDQEPSHSLLQTSDPTDTSRFKADKGFQGAQAGSARQGKPVEFEREGDAVVRMEGEEGTDEPDPFGLEEFVSRARKGKGEKSEKSSSSRK